MDGKQACSQISAWNDAVRMSKISLRRYVSMSNLGAKMHWSVQMLLKLQQEKTETNNIKSKIDDESDDNRGQSEASDADSENKDW